MLPVRLRIRLILMQLLSWFQFKPKFKVGDVVCPKYDSWQGQVQYPEYFKVVKIEKDTIYASKNGNSGVIFFDPKDIVKVELSELERIIYGIF